MQEITVLKEVRALRVYTTEPELPEAIKQLVSRAKVEEILPHIIQVQCSAEFAQTSEFEVILFGD